MMIEEYNQQLTKQQEEIATTANKLIHFVYGFAQFIRNSIVAINVCERIIDIYPNKRVVYLAKHHGKQRVRKKNINRIAKWVKSGGVKEALRK